MSNIQLRDTVIVNYQIGWVNDIYTRDNVEYVSVTTPKAENLVTASQNAVPVQQFLLFARKAGLEMCPVCHGTGRIDPIENPPYVCDCCNGEGYTVSQ
jgi:hypothetical protein